MNRYHHSLCRSPRWAGYVAARCFRRRSTTRSWALGFWNWDPDTGPAPEHSSTRCPTWSPWKTILTTVAFLRGEFGPTLNVVHGDAAQLPFVDASFSAVACFTMLHHLVDAEAQDRLFAEVGRVLTPGGLFVARDAAGSWRFRLIHLGDTCTPVRPQGLRQRLALADLNPVEIAAVPGPVQIRARRRQDAPSIANATGSEAQAKAALRGEACQVLN